MALTAQEQALLASLTAKATEPDPGPVYDSVPKILHYLVLTSSHFSANPDDRQKMLDYLETLIPETAAEVSSGVQAN